MEKLSKNKAKWVRSLHLSKNRKAEGVFIVEGEKMILELMESNFEVIALFSISEDLLNSVSYPGFMVSESELAQISTLKSPNHSLAVVKQPSMQSTLDEDSILVLDGIQDPGNMGTIIRTADWFGIKSILCSMDTVDCFNPKVVQATMGSIFRVSIVYGDIIQEIQKHPRTTYGALLHGVRLSECVVEKPYYLILGNEGNGISPEVISHITKPVTIPGYGGSESLNVGVANGILLHHFTQPV